MAITTFLDPAQMPARTQDQQTFDNLMAQFMQNLPLLGAQINATEAGMNSIAAGGAYAIPYAVDFSSTADGDPGNGRLRFNSATQSAATALYLDVLGFDTADYTGLLDTFDMSSSTIKGTLRLVKLGDPKKFLAFFVTARVAATGYRKLSVAPIVSSVPNPFAAGDVVLVQFTPSGERGGLGVTGFQVLASTVVSTPVAAVSFVNFTADYDKYVIDALDIGVSSSAYLLLRMVNGSTVDTANGNYFRPAPDGSSGGSGNGFDFGTTGGPTAAPKQFTIEIRDANRALGRHKGVSIRGTDNSVATIREAVYVGGVVSGVQILPSTGNFTSGTFRVFGIKSN